MQMLVHFDAIAGVLSFSIHLLRIITHYVQLVLLSIVNVVLGRILMQRRLIEDNVGRHLVLRRDLITVEDDSMLRWVLFVLNRA